MPLVIESWPAAPSYFGEKRHVSVAHYFEQQGDLIADPDLVTDTGFPIELTQVLGYTEVLEGKDLLGQPIVEEIARSDVEDFLAMWANNLVAQGWIQIDQLLAELGRMTSQQEGE